MPPKKPGAGAKAYHRAEPMPNGEVLTDICHKSWKIGKSIGSGGFGEIYLASDEVTKSVNDRANYVVKIEPLANGPLFVEIAFYIRVAKSEMIEEYKRSRGLESLGMPCYVASGNHDCRNQKYRFLVIPRFGQDLHKFIQEKSGKRLGIRAVQALSLQILDILEYIHEKGFVHGDIKASNLLLGAPSLGNKKKQYQQIFAADFGLAQKYIESNGSHVEYSPDLRKANNGTLEYSSRDAHIGAFSRRSDLEVLGFNMLEWLCGKMPWNADTPHEKVLKQKQALMTDVNLKKIYPPEIQGLDIVERFLKYVQKLEFKEKPNYAHCKDILRKGLPSSWKGSLYLEDPGAGAVVKSSKSASKRLGDDDIDAIAKKICVPEVMEEESNPKRSTRNTIQVKDFNWARILSTDPEKIVRSAASFSQHSSTPKDELSVNKTPSPVQIHSNPTPAMLQILSRKKENIRSPIKAKVVEPQGTSELTPAMKEILMRRKKTQTQLFKTDASAPSSSRRLRRNPQN